jgi:predicted ATPase
MKLNIKVSNFGKIKDAKLYIRPFTVIAGKNSSGKSFVTKALYSFFSTINKDFVTAEAIKTISRINMRVQTKFHSIRLSSEEAVLLQSIEEGGIGLHKLVEELYGENTFTSQLEGSKFLNDKTLELKQNIDHLISVISPKRKFLKIKDDIEQVALDLKNLETIFLKPIDLFISRIRVEFGDSLKDNFQTTSLSSLKNFNSPTNAHAQFEFDTIGKIVIQGENVGFSIQHQAIDLFQEFSNIVYIESPIYWRLKESLEKVRASSKFSFLMRYRKQESLSGVPRHFYDLVDLLQERLKGNIRSSDYAEVKKKIEKSIGGELSIAQSGEINFKESNSDKEINLHTTATGIVNLGIIGLLIERNVISRGSYIFIDEPEVNLHPAWQKVMVEALYELSKSGINIVVATHSIDMMKCIEGIVENLPPEEAAEHFGINQLSCEGTSIESGEYPVRRIASIKADLGESFYKMQIESGW